MRPFWSPVFALMAILLAPFLFGSPVESQVPEETASALPDSVPLFPLPDITLFPGARQPIHIFEPRYREMVTDALASDSVIGMVMLRPGWEGDYEGNPPVYDLGGAGVIENVQELPDGRFNLLVRGTSKFRVQGEETSRAYRLARVEPIAESLTDDERVRLSRLRTELEERIRDRAPDVEVPAELSDAIFVSTLCQFLPLEPADRQELLRAEDSLARAELLMELLGMVQQAGRKVGVSGP